MSVSNVQYVPQRPHVAAAQSAQPAPQVDTPNDGDGDDAPAVKAAPAPGTGQVVDIQA